MSNTASSKNVEWFSSILRWGLGILFMFIGYIYWSEGGWPAIVFGIAFFVSGFFRPKRCIDGSCELPIHNKEQQ